MSTAQAINQAAAHKKAAEQQAAAAAQAKAKAPPKELLNLRHTKPGSGSLMFPPSLDSEGFELKPGDNVIDVAKITPAVQAQLVEWVNLGWIEVIEVTS